ncbi:hypothetical protein [Terripilifer ovatus]
MGEIEGKIADLTALRDELADVISIAHLVVHRSYCLEWIS